MRRSLSLIILTFAAAGPAAAQPPHPPGGPGGMGRGLFVSPAGEPFRRGDATPQPLRAWFEQADTDHDGALGWAEFQADFVRYFAILDADHDGEIAPAEVAHYEQDILPEMQSRFGPGGGGMRIGGGAMRRGRDGVGGGGRRAMQNRGGGGDMAGRMAMMSGAARFGLLPIAHPVMDADIDFNRGVSLREFTQAAGRRFAMLDTAHTGRLTLPQLIEARRQAFGTGRRDAPGLGDDEGEGEGAPPPPRH